MNPIRFFIPILLSFSFSVLLAQVPANDLPEGAIELTVHNVPCIPSDAITGESTDELTSAFNARPECISREGYTNPIIEDLWYKFTVPDSESVVMQGYLTTPIVIVYTKDEQDNYTQIACSTFDFEEYLFEGLAGRKGQVIYLQVFNSNLVSLVVYGSFSICLWDYSQVESPSNGSPDTATSLPIESSHNPIEGTLTKASLSSFAAPSCRGGSSNPYPDVWYKASVPDSGKMTVEVSAGSGVDLGQWSFMEAFTKSGETYTAIMCSQGEYDRDNDEVIYPKIELTDRTAGEEIYFQISDLQTIGLGSAQIGRITANFNIRAFDPASLDVPTVPNSLLSYYSNPVGNRLSIESPYDIQSLSVYDLVGREVISKTSQQQKLTLDTYALTPGVYMLNVQTQHGQETVKLVKN